MNKYESGITTGTIKNSKPYIKIIIIFMVMLIGAGLVFALAKNIYTGNQHQITNVFADVNGDGKEDLIVSGMVIYNSEEMENLPVSQLNP